MLADLRPTALLALSADFPCGQALHTLHFDRYFTPCSHGPFVLWALFRFVPLLDASSVTPTSTSTSGSGPLTFGRQIAGIQTPRPVQVPRPVDTFASWGSFFKSPASQGTRRVSVCHSLRYEQPQPARLNASRPPGWRRTPRLRWRTPRAEAPRVKSAPRPRSCGPRPAETSIVGSGSGTSPRCISRLGGATRASSALCATPARRSPRATARADGPRCTAPSTTGTRAPPPRSSRAARASTPRSTGWADPRWTSSPERSADASTTTPSTVRVRIDRPRPRPAPPPPSASASASSSSSSRPCDLYSWGSGVNFQLGTGAVSEQPTPRRVDDVAVAVPTSHGSAAGADDDDGRGSGGSGDTNRRRGTVRRRRLRIRR